MDSSIGKPYLFLPTAKDVWEVVRDCYSDLENSSQIYELKTQLWQSKQRDKDITTFYNLMVTLWQELDQCYEDDWENPNDATRFKKREKNDRVCMFLAGLNQELDEVCGRILGRKPLSSMREVFSKVRREESRRKIMLRNSNGTRMQEAESSALVARGHEPEGEKKKRP